jgi:hypothetical protein
MFGQLAEKKQKEGREINFDGESFPTHLKKGYLNFSLLLPCPRL